MCIRPVMTYACPVFAHAAPTALQDLQVIQNKFCRRATGAQCCGLVRGSSENHFLRRPRNASQTHEMT
ncbi:hypothetical protein EVAR_25335_1 [Eumeta japonica]|uniref:Uncharacterized protein n=1 Tax=Eumeta variegata TaxID=151549 RepID=A0A4C1Y048_EUMVA|nr:hypothetical protein EVAR_25335_1 [Eumeta japonica]